MVYAKEGKLISVDNAKINQTDFVRKSGSSNLLVSQKRFIVVLRILVLSVVLNDIFPKSDVVVF